MAIRNIRKIGDPVLRMKAKKVKKITDKTLKLIEDMFETLHDAPGVGLAAPQVGVSQRIIVVHVKDDQFALINPEIIEASGSQVGDEGCLSVPGEQDLVDRAEFVKVRGLDPNGEKVVISGEGLLARCLQHEIDHLDGILFVDKIYLEES